MNKFKNLIINFFAFAMISTTFVGVSYAKDGVQILSSAWVVKETKVNDEVKKSLEEAKKVYPGDSVVLRNSVINNSAKPISDIEVVNPIPKNIGFVSAALVEGVEVLYSIDGKVFAKEKDLFVVEKSGEKRTASKEDYTHIKWKIKTSVKSGETKNVEFTGYIK